MRACSVTSQSAEIRAVDPTLLFLPGRVSHRPGCMKRKIDMTTMTNNPLRISTVLTDISQECLAVFNRFLEGRRKQHEDLRRIRKLASMGDVSLADIGLMRADLDWISRLSMSDAAYAELADRARMRPLS